MTCAKDSASVVSIDVADNEDTMTCAKDSASVVSIDVADNEDTMTCAKDRLLADRSCDGISGISNPSVLLMVGISSTPFYGRKSTLLSLVGQRERPSDAQSDFDAAVWRSTYNHLSSWLTDARNLTNPNTVIILIGNKADLEAQRDVTYEEAKQFAEENGLLFLEASAKTGENVEDAFLEAAKKIYQNIQDGSLDLNAAESGVQHKPSAPQGGRLTSEPQPQREGCGC
ncbi:ras-related protein Rab-14 [Bombina bombina]|uniref:ras-related protein Rab-14 n=1 Tax=Bombina bombina TaxID=8345 RepID=UPI00235AA4E4|nr:ras-related protein Rab-14 [Bombina bombina]